jgi:hypothetical protein
MCAILQNIKFLRGPDTPSILAAPGDSAVAVLVDPALRRETGAFKIVSPTFHVPYGAWAAERQA